MNLLRPAFKLFKKINVRKVSAIVVMLSGSFHVKFWSAVAAHFVCAPLFFAAHAGESSDNSPKVAVIYTITNPKLKEDVERAVRDEFGGKVEILRYEDASIFEETAKAGRMGREPAAKFVAMYADSVRSGARAVLSVCSTVSDLAYSMRETGEFVGVPIVGMNDEMCREAVRIGGRILIAATFPSAVEPTKRSILRAGAELGRNVEISEAVVGGGFGSDSGAFEKLLSEKLREPAKSADVIVFAQASMAPYADYVEKACGKRVLSNPKFGARALKSALAKKRR